MKKSICFIFLCTFSSIYASLDMMFEKAGVVPDVIDQAPTSILTVTYRNQVVVELGKELTPTQVQNQPTISWTADPTTYYTLLMVDPDAPSRRDPKFREVKHWFVGNILGNNIGGAEHIAEYVGSGPPKDTGLHRYIFLLYKQPGKIDFTREPKSPMYSREHRLNFSTKKFSTKYSLGNPIAGNFYVAQWDPYVEERNKKIAEYQSMMQMKKF